MIPDLAKLTITQAQADLRAGKYSAVELTQVYLTRIASENPKLNAYLEVFADALEQAKQADQKLKAGDQAPLLGIPLAIKDNILIEGKIASSASQILANYVASYDATVIKKLKAAGAIFLGRTNMDEFAMGGSTENSAYGPTKNPHDPTRVAGGSSGGSAAAVGGDLALGALGSDTGGSIRQPAAYCGVVGLKPTYGAVSRSGVMAMASSLDQIGPLTKTVADAELLFKIIAGPDELDATSAKTPSVKVSQTLGVEKSALKIGVPEIFLASGVNSEVLANFRASLERLKALGHEVVEVSLPNLKYAMACYYILMPAEASTNLARYDGIRYGVKVEGANLLEDYKKTRGVGFGAEVRRRIMLGTYVLSAGYYDAYYGQAVAAQKLIKQDFRDAFKTVDAIALPTAPTTAFKLGQNTADPLQMYLEDIFTVPANLAGLPAISLPRGKDSSGLPFGLQLVAPHFGESRLFALGRALEHELS